MPTKVVHLVDDAKLGGVMRSVEYLRAERAHGSDVEMSVQIVRRGMTGAPKCDADLIVSHLSISWKNLPMMIALRARYAHLPIVHVEHSYSESFVAHNVRAKRRFKNLLRISLALFNRVVAVSRAQADWMTREGLVRADALRVISSSVDLKSLLTVEPASGRSAKVIGAVGRLHPQKGFDELIKAFRRCAGPDQVLRIVGEGPEEENLRALADDDRRIEFHPFTDNPAAAYAHCDVIALPSLWEPYGLVALEARAAGRPVLAAEVDGLIDQIEDGCIRVPVDGWGEAIAEIGGSTHTARIAAARRQAIRQNQQFKTEWRRLIADLTAPPRTAAAVGNEPLAA